MKLGKWGLLFWKLIASKVCLTEQYVLVYQLTDTRIARYQAMPPKSAVDDRFRLSTIDFDRRRSIEGETRKRRRGEKYLVCCSSPVPPRSIARRRRITCGRFLLPKRGDPHDSLLAGDSFSPRGRRFVCPRGEKDRGDAARFKEAPPRRLPEPRRQALRASARVNPGDDSR
ncbi:hypothetical protein BHM03_00061924 [Ensete ventricosum]|nr:hypothetical protein BHM03_00061924 [Ensete ventricosum]